MSDNMNAMSMTTLREAGTIAPPEELDIASQRQITTATVIGRATLVAGLLTTTISSGIMTAKIEAAGDEKDAAQVIQREESHRKDDIIGHYQNSYDRIGDANDVVPALGAGIVFIGIGALAENRARRMRRPRQLFTFLVAKVLDVPIDEAKTQVADYLGETRSKDQATSATSKSSPYTTEKPVKIKVPKPKKEKLPKGF